MKTRCVAQCALLGTLVVCSAGCLTVGQVHPGPSLPSDKIALLAYRYDPSYKISQLDGGIPFVARMSSGQCAHHTIYALAPGEHTVVLFFRNLLRKTQHTFTALPGHVYATVHSRASKGTTFRGGKMMTQTQHSVGVADITGSRLGDMWTQKYSDACEKGKVDRIMFRQPFRPVTGPKTETSETPPQ